MLILFAGNVGSGKTTLAARLSADFGIPLYEVDRLKRELYPLDPDFERNMQESIPFKDETRMTAYRRACEELKAMAASHPHVLVDEAMHKRIFRETFRTAAEPFGGSYLILVRISEETMRRRLTPEARPGHMVRDPLAMALALEKQSEPMDDEADLVVDNDGPPEEAYARILRALSPLLA